MIAGNVRIVKAVVQEHKSNLMGLSTRDTDQQGSDYPQKVDFLEPSMGFTKSSADASSAKAACCCSKRVWGT
jgi:hypothetical protein